MTSSPPIPRLPIRPRKISLEELLDYTGSWKQLLNRGCPDDLRACFSSTPETSANLPNPSINFAYLTANELTPLLQDAQPSDLIKTKFLLLPGKVPVFNLALMRTDELGQPKTDYYLAGIAKYPATLGPDISSEPTPTSVKPSIPSGKVPADTARAWIKHWHELPPAELKVGLFNSTQDGQYLRGYTFDVSDFTTPWPYAQSSTIVAPKDAALWFNFDMKPQEADAPDSPLVFSTIVDINTIIVDSNMVPIDGQPLIITLTAETDYYDVSRPSPPY